MILLKTAETGLRPVSTKKANISSLNVRDIVHSGGIRVWSGCNEELLRLETTDVL